MRFYLSPGHKMLIIIGVIAVLGVSIGIGMGLTDSDDPDRTPIDSVNYEELLNNETVTDEETPDTVPPADTTSRFPFITYPQITTEKRPVVTVAIGEEETKPAVTTAVTTAPVTTEEDRFKNVPADLKEHIYIESRLAGNCKALKGNVYITFIFINDSTSSWSAADLSTAKSSINEELNKLASEAKSYGVSLNATYQTKTANLSYDVAVSDTSFSWKNDALKSAGLSVLGSVNDDLKKASGADEAPVVFIFNKTGRALGYSTGAKTGAEYAILYKDIYPLRHELYHCFGAKDFYFPNDVSTAASKYLPNSIMTDSAAGKTDSLTAFLIGWTDTLDSNAKSFLYDTDHITAEFLKKENEEELFTGYGTKESNGEVYTGYMVQGIPHGQGTKKWADGGTYTGNWDNGNMHGQGTMTWADGSTYTGNWVNGKREGSGTMKWKGGSTYTGAWSNHNQNGKGTMTYDDGTVYTGDFVDGNRHGQGKYTWANGDYYEGAWVNGQRTGYGVYRWASGSYYQGYWNNSKRHGQGTEYRADGTVSRSGTWNNDSFVG